MADPGGEAGGIQRCAIFNSRRAIVCRRLKRGGADGDDFNAFGDLDRLHGVARIDRPLKRISRDDRGDLSDHLGVEQGRRAGHNVLPPGGRGRHNMAAACCHVGNQGGQFFGQAVGVVCALNLHNLRNARELRGLIGNAAAVLTRNQDSHVAAHLGGCGHRVGNSGGQIFVIVFGKQ